MGFILFYVSHVVKKLGGGEKNKKKFSNRLRKFSNRLYLELYSRMKTCESFIMHNPVV